MRSSEQGQSQRRLFTSYLTSIISIMLLLFLLGLLGFIVINTKRLSDYVRENIGFSVMLSEASREPDIIRLQKLLDGQVYVRTTEYITRDEAARRLQDELGEDFVGFFGYNPLVPLIEVKLHADWANEDSISRIDSLLRKNSLVTDVYYEKDLITQVNRNVHKISLIIIGFSGLLLLIALALINNTIRLSVYSRRFLIRTMQLVGATPGFIRRPFLVKSAVHGLYAGIAAVGLITLLLYYISRAMQEMVQVFDTRSLLILFTGVIVLGVSLNTFSTFFAVNRYLRMKTDDFYN
ncbi:MAG: permease-like cell division protein FtsX [Bacteroidales bacterium]